MVPFHIQILLPLHEREKKNSVKISPTEEAWIFERSGLGHSLIIVWILKTGCLSSVDFRVILNILEVGLL